MIKMFEDFIKENMLTYEKGCAMLYFNFPMITELHNKIDLTDIYTKDGDRSYGLEEESHCTLLYGLDAEVTVNEVTSVLNNFIFGDCVLHNASLFENEDFDVLKFDVKSASKDNLFLPRCNKMLSKLPHKTDYPDYHPHLTIGYIKKGKGLKYSNMLKGKDFKLTPTHAVFSQPNGTKHTIKIKTDN
jgi:hypothetical protein